MKPPHCAGFLVIQLRLSDTTGVGATSSKTAVDLLGAAFENLFIDLLAPYLHIVRRSNPQLYLAVSVAEYNYFDIATDDDGFVLLPGEY